MSTLKSLRKTNPTEAQRVKRAIGIRKRVSGTAERPRLSVFRTARHIYVQAVDDATGTTIACASTMEPAVKASLKGLKKSEQATKIGELLGKRLVEKGVKSGIFDRNGFRYHGRVAAIADGAREAGLQF